MKKSIEIIIVDDQEEMINSIRPFFSKTENLDLKGTANSGKASLGLIKAIQPDIVLMDVKMETPKAGIEAVKSLMNKPSFKTKVIFLTAYPNIEDAKKALDLYCSFVDKRCSIPRIIQIIEEVIYRNKLIIEIQSSHFYEK